MTILWPTHAWSWATESFQFQASALLNTSGNDLGVTVSLSRRRSDELTTDNPIALSKELYNIDFTNPDGWSLGYRSPDYNPFIGSFNSNTLASYIFKNDDGDPGTDWYKHMLNTSTTLVLAAWPKSPTGDWKLDVRVACLTAGAGVLLGSEGPNSSPHVTALSIPAQVLMLSAVVLAVV